MFQKQCEKRIIFYRKSNFTLFKEGEEILKKNKKNKKNKKEVEKGKEKIPDFSLID